MTSDQLDPSAQDPCTSTTLRACAGMGAWAGAFAAKSVAESTVMATIANFCRAFICHLRDRLGEFVAKSK
jgi:hypothetical protein